MSKFIKCLIVSLVLLLSLAILVACNGDKGAPSGAKPQLTEAEIELNAANAEETELEFLYISDTHYMREEEVGNYAYASFQKREMESQKMNHISEAVFKQFCDEVIASGIKTLLIGGDINETGSREGHVEIVNHLERLRDAGISVYVVPGNHDSNAIGRIYTSNGTSKNDGVNTYTTTTNKDFAEIYANFGYTGTNRIEPDNSKLDYSGALSYSVDLNSKYTLIAFDNSSGCTENYKAQPTTTALDWAVAQVAATVADGKLPILMMHKPLTEVFTGLTNIAGLTVSGEFSDDNAAFAKKLYDAGLRYTFVGHMHSCDVMLTDYNDEDTNPGILQIMNGTLTSYNSSYFDVKFKPNYLDLTVKRSGAPKESYLPSYLTADDKQTILSDWDKYTYDYTLQDFFNKILVVKNTIATYFAEFACGIKYSDMTTEQQKTVDDYVDGIFAYLNAPIFTKDKQGSETSLEELFAKFGFTGTLPDCGFTTVSDVIMDIITTCFTAGNKELQVDDAQWSALKYVIYGLIAHLVDSDLYGMLEDFGVLTASQNVDSAPMVTKLINEGILDLETYKTIDNILRLPVINNLKSNGAVGTIIKSVESMGFWDFLSGTGFNLIKTLLGGYSIKGYFLVETDTTGTAKKAQLSGEIDINKLMDEFVFVYIGDGLFFDSIADSKDIVYKHSTGKAYDKPQTQA